MNEPVNDAERQIPGLIRKILLVDEITREAVSPFRSQSLPGHLIHVVFAGEVRQQAEGRIEILRGGDAVWYHESEPVSGQIVRAPWRFITIGFEAPELAPPADHNRVLPTSPRTLELARRLLEFWRDQSAPPLHRQLRAMTTLMELILEIHPGGATDAAAPVYPANARELWWNVEKQLRMLMEEPLTLERIAALAGMSQRTVARACKAATGMTPGQRLRDLRIAHAASLLQHTDLSVTEISFRVGFSRVQEFSRYFKHHTGLTPGEIRRSEAAYKNLQP